MSYFDIFNYPLNPTEILNFLSIPATKPDVETSLNKLTRDKQISRKRDLYSLQFDDSLFERRRKGNLLAETLLPAVTSKANLIFKFPFVRAVMASGSFSKNFMDEKSDFDYFIVCAPQRVWISRMLLVLYKKLFLKNSHRYFCINYFIDESNLEIDEKNIFTATELATVLPLTSSDHYKRLISVNMDWIIQFFPNFRQRVTTFPKGEDRFLKTLLETIINTFLGNALNRLFKRITVNRWRKTYGHLYSPSDFKIAFKSTDHVSKNHPRNFQKRIIEAFEIRANALAKKVEVYE